MNRSRRIVLTCLGLAALALAMEIIVPRPWMSVFGLVTAAEARVGRPATPVSVAGAGRRTVRRCAAGVYYC